MAGDVVAVVVCGDCVCGFAPGYGLVLVGGYLAECCGPEFVGVEGGVEDGVGSGFDEVAALVEGGSHLRVGHAVGVWDEAGDQTGYLSCAAGAGGACGGSFDAVVEVGGGEPARCNEAWQEGIEVVVVGFGPAQFGCERAEGVGVDGGVCLLKRETGGMDEGCPAVVLGCCGGVVFGGELGDRVLLVVFGGDGLVGGGFGSGVL